MDFIKYDNEHYPEVNSVGKCLKKCEVILEDGTKNFAYFSSVAGWFYSPSFYFEDKVTSSVKFWKYC